MAFSYDSSQFKEKPVNYVRFLLQDTTEAGHYLEDAEIEFVLEDQPNVNLAAARLARIISASLALLPEIDDPVLKIKPKERAESYMKLAKSFDDEYARAGKTFAPDTPAEGAGLISLFDNSSNYGDSAFSRDM